MFHGARNKGFEYNRNGLVLEQEIGLSLLTSLLFLPIFSGEEILIWNIKYVSL